MPLKEWKNHKILSIFLNYDRITVDNIHVSIVGHNQEFKILSPQDLSVFFVNSLSKNLGIASKHGDNLK